MTKSKKKRENCLDLPNEKEMNKKEDSPPLLNEGETAINTTSFTFPDMHERLHTCEFSLPPFYTHKSPKEGGGRS